jgi:septal ring factor EnvC (AmiA/AmiB activator)
MEDEHNGLTYPGNPEKTIKETKPSNIDSMNEEEVKEVVSSLDEPEKMEPITKLDVEPGKETSSVENKKMPGWLRNFLFGLAAVLVIFAAGFIVSQITSTQPARNKLAQLSLEEKQLQENLLSVQNELDLTKNDLNITRTALSTNQSDLKSAESEIEDLQSSANYNQNFSELKYYVALARIALLNTDKLSARQAISLAQDNFEIISPYLDADNREAVDQRLADAYKLVSSNMKSALDELKTLSENLERIPVQ